MPRPPGQPLAPDDLKHLRQVREVYPPGPLSNGDKAMAEEFGFSHTTLRNALRGHNLSARVRRRIEARLPELVRRFEGDIRDAHFRERAFDECTPHEKMHRLVDGMPPESVERLMKATRALFEPHFK